MNLMGPLWDAHQEASFEPAFPQELRTAQQLLLGVGALKPAEECLSQCSLFLQA